MSRKHTIPLSNLNGRFLRHISPAEADRLFRDGAVFLSFQSKKDSIPSSARLIDPRRELRIMPKSSITAAEIEAYAGRHFKGGKSRTARMSEQKKQVREASGRMAEDFIERTEGKVGQWHQRDAKAPLAR